ncbi:MAG TPA: hypothetical protein VGY99_11005 [Candidatus Binataceae bacterium]|nr:hypothetical protein [Candidatus Binataceae bacterium]
MAKQQGKRQNNELGEPLMKFAVAPIFARPIPFTAEFVAYLAELLE